MTYFKTRELAAISIFAALWGILNVLISPTFFQIFHLPFACDLIGFSSLILATWWSRKIGTGTFVGFIALIINLIGRPTTLHFLGFFAAAAVFDVLTYVIGYKNLFEKKLSGSVILLTISLTSAAFAGLLIGALFMAPIALVQWGGVFGWAGLHAIGGVIGGAIGVTIMNALGARGFAPKTKFEAEI